MDSRLFWHNLCGFIIFRLYGQLYWADGLKVFRRRKCPPDFFGARKTGLAGFASNTLHSWSRSGGGAAPDFLRIQESR
jgi:hypothetical protein